MVHNDDGTGLAVVVSKLFLLDKAELNILRTIGIRRNASDQRRNRSDN